jgi:ribokinase
MTTAQKPMSANASGPNQAGPAAPRIAVVGSLNMDLIVRTPRLPRPGETLSGGEFVTAHGGKGANQAVAAARQGGVVSMIGCVGTDDFGSRLTGALTEDGIDTAHVTKIEDVQTGVAFILLDGGGQNSIVIAPGTNGLLAPRHIDAAADVIAAADILLCQLEVPEDAVETAMAISRENGTRVIFNPAPYSETCHRLLGLADVVVPNEIEAAGLSGIGVTDAESAGRAADALIDRGPDTVLITLGERGVYVADAGNSYLQEGFAVEAADTTAAGDTFVGAFAVASARGLPLEDAVRRAQAAAALAVTKLGAQPSIPLAADIDLFCQTKRT